MWTLLLMLSCGREDLAPVDQAVPTAAEPARHEPAGPEVVDLPGPAQGWGAVFWREGSAWRTGGGDTVIGPLGTGTALATDAKGPCGTRITGAPDKAMLAPPVGSHADAPTRPPAIAASIVERVAWRLDDVLPPPDRFTPITVNADPARQRGVEVGSVVKTRRHGAPPVLLAGGARDCTGTIVITDKDAQTVIDSVSVHGFCDLPRVLPPTDLDGDGARETALFNGTQVALFRLTEKSGAIGLTLLGGWRCELDPSTPPPALPQ